MKRWRTDALAVCGLVAAALAVVAVAGGPLPVRAESAAPIAGSFSREGLDRVSDYIRNEIATGKIPGAILLIQQHGKPVYSGNFGVRDVATKLPMSTDTIFRLYSMSKPITSVAAMMLVEDGKLRIDDPVSKFIPAFADIKVGVEKRGADGMVTLVREPLDRPVTIEDLLRHTSGLTYGFFGDNAVRKLYAG
jgi:CubicO group peptidase (beta-lactamase class C family)